MLPEPVEQGTSRVDGRVVAHRRYGAEPGPGVAVVVSCHGGLSCGADAALGHAAAAERGISLLAIDRPGVGRSDDQPGRTTGDWAVDLDGVLDDLGVARTLGIVGWSLGGQYALAARALLPDRIPAAAAVAGVPPLDQPHVRASLSTSDRMLLGAVRSGIPRSASQALFRRVSAAAARTMGAGSGPGPARLTLRTWGEADAAVLAGPAGPVLRAAVAEATASASGMAEEYRAWRRPWGVALDAVPAPVTIWQGDRDRLVPSGLGDRLVTSIPGSRLEPCPGQGHLLLASRWGDVLDGLG